MNANATDANESIDRRTRCGATECMTVMDDIGDTHAAEHRNPDGGCKHYRRVRMATGETSPRAVADGGEIVVGGDDGEILDETDAVKDTDERPDDCDCGEWNASLGLSCWPCFRDRFETPTDAPE